MSHKQIVCECGKVLSTCRCLNKHKSTEVSKEPCTHEPKWEESEHIPGGSYHNRDWERWRVVEVHDTEDEKSYILMEPIGDGWGRRMATVGHDVSRFTVGDRVLLELKGGGFNPLTVGLWDAGGRVVINPKSDEEMEIENRLWLAERKVKQLQWLKDDFKTLLAQEDALPAWIKRRMTKFREEGGMEFFINGFGYELHIAELAVMYAEGADEKTIHEYADKHGTSGNQHELAQALAKAHLRGEDLYGTVGGLSPITGDAYYSEKK